MSQMRTGGIPVQNLDQKQLDCRHGIEGALAPPVGDAATGRQDSLGRKLVCPMLLKLFDLSLSRFMVHDASEARRPPR